jgi:hypothetical protein
MAAKLIGRFERKDPAGGGLKYAARQAVVVEHIQVNCAWAGHHCAGPPLKTSPVCSRLCCKAPLIADVERICPFSSEINRRGRSRERLRRSSHAGLRCSDSRGYIRSRGSSILQFTPSGAKARSTAPPSS